MSPLGAWQAIGIVTQFGVTCAVAVWLGYFLGSWLDARLGTGLIFSLICALGGMISAITSTVALIKRIDRRSTSRSD